MRGIYKITNKINNKIYIGESLDIKRRWEEHIKELNENKHINYKLQEDWNKYGQDNFEFSLVCVLDRCINSYIDKYVCVIYEAKYIKEHNSIEAGYNIEQTILKVINGEKIIIDKKRDVAIIKKYTLKINNNEIRNIGGLICCDSYSIKDICEEYNLPINGLKNILLKNNYIVLKDKDYILNEKFFDESNVIYNEKFSTIKFNSTIYKYLRNVIDEFLKNNKQLDDNINDDLIVKSDLNESLLSLREFVNTFILCSNYIQLCKVLRDTKVLKYTYIEDRKYLYPTEEYEKCFKIEKTVYKNNKNGIRLLVTEEGKNVLKRILIKNNLIIAN